jgi:hypothetical protein
MSKNKRKRLNLWRLLPVVIEASRQGLQGIAEATTEDSDDGHNITREEARAIATSIGNSVSYAVMHLLEPNDG